MAVVAVPGRAAEEEARKGDEREEAREAPGDAGSCDVGGAAT